MAPVSASTRTRCPAASVTRHIDGYESQIDDLRSTLSGGVSPNHAHAPRDDAGRARDDTRDSARHGCSIRARGKRDPCGHARDNQTHGGKVMNGRTIGNLILMTTICVVIFWLFMALRPAAA